MELIHPTFCYSTSDSHTQRRFERSLIPSSAPSINHLPHHLRNIALFLLLSSLPLVDPRSKLLSTLTTLPLSRCHLHSNPASASRVTRTKVLDFLLSSPLPHLDLPGHFVLARNLRKSSDSPLQSTTLDYTPNIYLPLLQRNPPLLNRPSSIPLSLLSDSLDNARTPPHYLSTLII